MCNRRVAEKDIDKKPIILLQNYNKTATFNAVKFVSFVLWKTVEQFNLQPLTNE